MAHLDDLISQVDDATLRTEMQAALSALKKRQRFGLVYEDHLPEWTVLAGLPVKPGAFVQRKDGAAGQTYAVRSVKGTTATVETGDGETEEMDVEDLFVAKRFGEPIYPVLTPLGHLHNGDADRPHHAVINAENYHALQLLLYLYEGKVDCIYIDPPYNTGARDWKYNNDYVDSNDAWRHSKWLSMMERRLRLAMRLLRPDGVLIVTIDENEVHSIGMLLATLFPEAMRQMVTIVINPSGVTGAAGLSRVEEYAHFCFLGGSQLVETEDDMLGEERVGSRETSKYGVAWERLLRRGNKWYRDSRPNLCYPVLVNEDRTRLIRAADPYDGPEDDLPTEIDGHPVAWPIRTDDKLGIWRVQGSTLNSLIDKGYAYISSPPHKDRPTLRYLMSGTIASIDAGEIGVIGRGDRNQVLVESAVASTKRAKTVWARGRHIAGGGGGTQLLNAFLGERNVFPFPKSLYAVRDCLDVAVGDRQDALILDFFAGSGTTLHAVLALNAADGGRRRCVLVSNNEVGEDEAKALRQDGHSLGDPAYEEQGIFERATRRRIEAAVTGTRPDGKPVAGKYMDGTAYADGFPENVAFYRLDYVDPDEVELGLQADAIIPALWLMAGGVGEPELGVSDQDYSIPEGSTYAVLFRPSRYPAFQDAVLAHPRLTHVWIVTDSEPAFSEMRAGLPPDLHVSMLYRDYLQNFRIHTARPR